MNSIHPLIQAVLDQIHPTTIQQYLAQPRVGAPPVPQQGPPLGPQPPSFGLQKLAYMHALGGWRGQRVDPNGADPAVQVAIPNKPMNKVPWFNPSIGKVQPRPPHPHHQDPNHKR